MVETPRDVTSFERGGSFRGLYHVLGGKLAPLDGVGPEKLNLAPLVHRVQRGGGDNATALKPFITAEQTSLI